METLVFDGQSYVIHRRRGYGSIKLSLNLNGTARITIGRSQPLRHVLSFLEEKRDWLQKHRENLENHRAQIPRIDFQDGKVIPLRGQPIPIKVIKGAGRTDRAAEMTDGLWVSLRSPVVAGEEAPRVEKAVRKFISLEGRRTLIERVAHFSRLMGLAPKRLQFRSQNTRWGSCSTRGTVSLNWRLICAPPEILDYVVVHELSHLRHMNHSKKFWELVQTHVTDLPIRRSWLRENHLVFEFLKEP